MPSGNRPALAAALSDGRERIDDHPEPADPAAARSEVADRPRAPPTEARAGRRLPGEREPTPATEPRAAAAAEQQAAGTSSRCRAAARSRSRRPSSARQDRGARGVLRPDRHPGREGHRDAQQQAARRWSQAKRKLYPGYLMVEVEYNDRILYLFRETSGVGDFVGGGVNTAAADDRPRGRADARPAAKRQGEGRRSSRQAEVRPGDRVKVKDGTFAGMEGEVKEILEAKGLVRVELTIFGRPVPVELEYWQVEHGVSVDD